VLARIPVVAKRHCDRVARPLLDWVGQRRDRTPVWLVGRRDVEGQQMAQGIL